MPEISKESIDNVMFEVDKLEKEVSKLQMKREKGIQEHDLSDNYNGYVVDDLIDQDEVCVGVEQSNSSSKNCDDKETIPVVGVDPIITIVSEQNDNAGVDVDNYVVNDHVQVPKSNDDEVGSDPVDMNQQDEKFYSKVENNIKSTDMENGVRSENHKVDEAIVTEEKEIDSKSLEDDKHIDTEDSESPQSDDYDQIMEQQKLDHEILFTNEKGDEEEESTIKDDHTDDVEETHQTDNHAYQEIVVVSQGSFVDAPDNEISVDSNKEVSWRDMISRGKYSYTSSIS